MHKPILAFLAASALVTAAVPAMAQYGQPTGNPLSTIFACNNPGNRQGTGAVVGALVGALAGNQIADHDRTSGTVIGAAVGAAAGSMIGCRMQSQDAVRAQSVTQQALASGRSQSWSNPQTGASGRVEIIDTYNYGGGGGGYDRGGYDARPSLSTVRWMNGVEQPREYQPSEGSYAANGSISVRSGPSFRARQIDTLRSGEEVDGLVRVEGTDWVLVSRNNQVVGYVQESQTRFLGENRGRGGGYNGGGQRRAYDPRGGQMCRTFQQTFTYSGGQTETQRYNACQTASGEWVIQS